MMNDLCRRYGFLAMTFVLALGTRSASAQAVDSTQDAGLTLTFQLRVKQLSQFIERFNDGDAEFPMLYLAYAGRLPEREEVLASLAGPALDPAMMERFIDYVMGDTMHPPRYLDYYGDDWYARAFCRVTYQGRQYPLTLMLKKIWHPRRGSEWVIVQSRAEFLTLTRSDTTKFLNPLSHATYFLDLYRAFDDHGNARSYVPASYNVDALSILLYLIDRGEIAFDGVTHLDFHFLQLDGWILRIEEETDAGLAGGWLIADLLEVTTEQKNAYQRDILFIE